MNRQERLDIIQRLGKIRGSAIIAYITGDRENVNTKIAPDIIPVMYRHLELLGEQPKIELFLYTRGGDVLTPSRLIYLIREYTREFNVLVPFRAYSAGTLIALGADSIVMTRMGELGPIDPSVINAFNPQDPVNPLAHIPVTVEDVYSYLVLAKEIAGLHSDEAIATVFSLLVGSIHPLALGNVHRNYMLIRSLAHKIISLRCQRCEPEKIQYIIDNLTEKLYAHSHMISRREALEEIGLPVSIPSPEEEKLLWMLYQGYADELRLNEPVDLGMGGPGEFELDCGVVESAKGLDTFFYTGVIERRDEPGQVNVHILRQGWRTVE